MNKYLAYLFEFLITYIFILVIFMDSHILIIIVIFSTALLMGAHANPLITITKFVGKLDTHDPVHLIIIQLLAAVSALLSTKIINKNKLFS